MKRSLTLVLTAGAASLALAACNNAEENPGQTEPVNAAQDAMGAAVGAGAAMLGAQTVEGYVSNAAEGDMYEIQAADIALERTQNAQVRELAQMIKTDHTAASQRLRAAAQGAGQTLPSELDERRQGMLDNLRAASAADFDEVYVDQQVAAHNEALRLHRGFADNTDHPELAAHARSVVESIERHLRMAEQLDNAE